ncbi:hypothetical protein [Paenibacillus apiarius]|uniref:hypothetical protein n=1 Tax=Paenibacillus apiarius TaxID=46240 RepID=UPI003B3BD340
MIAEYYAKINEEFAKQLEHPIPLDWAMFSARINRELRDYMDGIDDTLIARHAFSLWLEYNGALRGEPVDAEWRTRVADFKAVIERG